MSASRSYQRFVLSQRIEHVVMLTSFTLLALTGLPQKFAQASISDTIIAVLGGIENVRVIHRIAATVMMLGTVYHLGAAAYKIIVRRVAMTMLPTLQDGLDAWQMFLYNLGLSKKHAQMGRYTFEEKAEYWAFVWGTIVMVITGFMMWNPIATARLLPGEIIPAAKAAHGGEAVLATLAILLWHMYGVHLKRFNKAMWTGRLSEEEMLEEHPLELADLKAGMAERPVEPVALKKRQQIFVPVAGVLSVAMLGGIYFFVSFEQTAITTLPPTQAVTVFLPQTPTPLPPTATPKPIGDLTWAGFVDPVFQNKCSDCHGTSGGLSFATYADALKGGDNGAVIVLGNAADSRIVAVQAAGDHDGQLNAEELEALKQWINLGAPEN